jgi:hypothetical protein
MSDNVLLETASALKNEWDLQLPEMISEEAILQMLADKVVQLIERGPGDFFQMMYRLDISEKKLNAVMHTDNAALKIAKLIYDRQRQKAESRLIHKAKKENKDSDLEW